eukprot:4167921-Prymnesium_polylepis.1
MLHGIVAACCEQLKHNAVLQAPPPKRCDKASGAISPHSDVLSFKCVGRLCVARWPDATALRS